MGEEKSRNLAGTEFEAVMKRASELAISDPYDGQGTWYGLRRVGARGRHVDRVGGPAHELGRWTPA